MAPAGVGGGAGAGAGLPAANSGVYLVLAGAIAGTAVSLACSGYFLGQWMNARIEALEKQHKAEAEASEKRRRRSVRPGLVDDQAQPPSESNAPAPEMLTYMNSAPAELPPHPYPHHHKKHPNRPMLKNRRMSCG